MDYLDPKKQREHAILLMVGYILIAIAILGTLRLLFYMAYGYGLSKNGQIIQNGFVYVSSQPHPANIYLNGQPSKYQTNARLGLPAGSYKLRLTRSGYRDWQREVTVLGGDVQHFDYPLLVPQTLTTTPLTSYTAPPGLATQSPDHRWLLVEKADSFSTFDLYDLKNLTKAATPVVLPASLLGKAVASQSWQLVEWSTDNQHVLLEHLFDDKSEFIVVDRQNPDQSVNLNNTLGVSPTRVSLNNKKYDQYYLYNADDHSLQTASLNSPTPAAYLDHVLAYKSYGDNTVLYVTDTGAPAGKVAVKLQVGSKTYAIRTLAAGSIYLLDLTQYAGPLYVVAGSDAENKVYIYKDPVGQINAKPSQGAIALRALRLSLPNYVAFSANAQFIMAEDGTAMAVYDIENSKSYSYVLPQAPDAPEQHVSWMDGDRLVYVAGGELIMLDYDDTNRQSLVPELPSYTPFFSPDYRRLYSLATDASGKASLAQTWLLTAADQ